MAWFKRRMIPPEVVTEIFDICGNPCNSDRLIRLKSFIDLYSMKEIDSLVIRETTDPYYLPDGRNPFMTSLYFGNVNVAQLLFNSGSDVTKRSLISGSVLDAAAGNKNFLNILQSILIKGGNPNICYHGHPSPLGRAALQSNLDAVKMLIHYGAKPRYCDDCVVLWTWAFDGDRISPLEPLSKDSLDYILLKGEAILEELVEAGACLSSASIIRGDGKTPIQTIKTRQQTKKIANKVIKMLIKHGADPNVK